MYKIIKDNKVIDVIKYADFIRFLPTGRIIRTCENLAEGVISSNHRCIYSFLPNKGEELVIAEKISEEEFNRLKSLLNSEQVVVANKTLLEKAIIEVVDNLSEICNNKIISGFSAVLSDGNKHSFRLTPEDQINLLSLENQLNSGEQTFIYHATGMPCRVFLRKDIVKIIKAYRKHVLYHTTYFNVAKQYVNSLTDIDKIKAFSYGDNIAGMTKDPTLRKILHGGDKL
jgi:hypothetical protein